MAKKTTFVKFHNIEAAIDNALNADLANGKRWQKGDHDRIYFNNVPYIKSIYLDCKTGILHFWADFDGMRTGKAEQWYGVTVDQIRGRMNKDMQTIDCDNALDFDHVEI